MKPLLSHSDWIVVSEVPLDEKNGAGMRAIIPYLKALKNSQPNLNLTSLYLAHQSYSGKNLDSTELNVSYVEVPYVNRRGRRVLSAFFGTWKKLRSQFKKSDHFLILPNSIRDVIMGLACRVFSRNQIVWVMDDFVETYSWKGRFVRWFCSKLFQILYVTAARRIVVAQPMSDAYFKLYGKKSDLILGKSLIKLLPPASEAGLPISPASPSENQPLKIRLVYVGSFIEHYLQPILVLKEILVNLPENLRHVDVRLDLYGMNPPPAEWLLDSKVIYQGEIPTSPDDAVLQIMARYDFGLVPYSFALATQRMMALSFPSKLIDYLGASLPCFIIAPESLSFLEKVRDKNAGVIVQSISTNAVIEGIQSLVVGKTSSKLYEDWRKNCRDWAEQDFLFDLSKLKKILYLDS